MQRSASILLLLFLTAAPAGAFDYAGWQAGPWEPLGEEDGVRLWVNESSPTDIDALRGDIVIDAPPSTVFPLIMDHDRAQRPSSVHKYEVLSDDGRTLRIYQQIKRFGLGKRELSVVGRVTTPARPDGGDYAFEYTLDPNAKDDPDVDAVKFVGGSYVLTPTDGGKKTLASYRTLLDPGSWVPDALLRRALRSNVVEVLTGLRSDATRQ